MCSGPDSQPVFPIVEGECNKCGGYRKELVFEGRLCGNCSTTVDERWATNTSTDWVLVEHLAEGAAPSYGPDVGVRNDLGEVMHTFRKVSYPYMKSIWAEIVGNRWSIRPASPEEIANRSRTFQILCQVYEIVDKWGFDSKGQPPGGIWDDLALQRGKGALEEVKKRLEDLGFLANLDYWKLPQSGLSPYDIAERVKENASIEGSRSPDARHGQSQVVGTPAVSVPEGTCNKCGNGKQLVFKGRVCESCSRALDELWARTASTDWVLIERPAEGADPSYSNAGTRNLWGEVVHTFRRVTYADIKSLWAAYSNKWSIRPATPAEVAAGSLTLQIWEEVAAIVEKWGFDINGEPAGGVWDDSALLQGKNALEEVRKRLEEFGMQLPDEWEIADGGLSPFEIEEFAHEEGTPTPYAGPAWQQLAKDLGFKRGCSSKTAASVLAKMGIKRIEEQQAALVTRRGLSQVVGMAELKQQLSHEIIEAFRNPDLYRRYRVSVPNGILFYGPPGCGKTYIARCLAEELGFFFQYCRPSDVASPFIHDTVRKIRELFTSAIEKAPSVLFIDEFEAFVPARSELGGFQSYKAEEVNEFLANLEGCAERNVLVIAATNEPDRIDPAVRRTGRFDKLIYIPPPDAKARAALLAHYLEGRPLAEPIDGEGIAAVLDGYSASDIKFLTDEAARMALVQSEPISTETLLAAMGRVPPSITREDEQRYSSFRSRGI